ncbi:LacI family DNA-binding transcriptional regulator [Klebsiella sp. BIGb0407]|uniref:LacI family DNA-binding transcriptional regulator n=1 Tax=Klebsiella sp. BIGb0407 TaxID=2940603 RepID=UPI0021692C12|nr:LacI family DNA-binding transcriptional regulator [Klebsiella sp. BIGb0407]MCS3434284.1 LacI family transcriptional regulator [Klebsiella sp. BIGb0407]
MKKPKMKTATVYDIARIAGVSVSTVSRILTGSAKVSKDKRSAVERAIEELDFRPNLMAQSLKSGQSMTLGVLTQHLDSPFTNEMLRGVEKNLEGTGYVPIIVSGHWNPLQELERIQLLIDRRVDGIIILTGHVSQQHLIELSLQVPIAVAGHDINTESIRSFNVNNRLGGYLATQHLLELGHRKIAHIVGEANQNDAIERLLGYRHALNASGIEYDNNLVIQGDFTEKGGRQAIKQLLDNNTDFTAVFCANDQTAYGAILGIKDANLEIPDDISVIGFDDLPFSTYSNPPLTTIKQPIYETGVKLAESLLNLINRRINKSACEKESSLPDLYIISRQTTKTMEIDIQNAEHTLD